MGQNIRLKPELQVRSRLRVLYDVIDELIRSFCLDPSTSTSEILRKGILERQYLSAIHVYLIGSDNKYLAEITLGIDWNLHAIKVSSGEREFRIDANRSISEQISAVYSVINKHIQRMKAAFKIKRSEVWFTYRSDVSYEEAKKYCGTGEGTLPEPSQDSKDGEVILRFVSEALEELSISVRHKWKA